MRFALATSNEHTTWPALRALWEAADAVELWESAWTGDHFMPFLGDPGGPCFEGWVLLTALAQPRGASGSACWSRACPTATRPCWPRWRRPSTS